MLRTRHFVAFTFTLGIAISIGAMNLAHHLAKKGKGLISDKEIETQNRCQVVSPTTNTE